MDKLYGHLADFALDDLEFSGCGLSSPTQRDCHPFEFRCVRDVCVDKDRLCDFTGGWVCACVYVCVCMCACVFEMCVVYID